MEGAIKMKGHHRKHHSDMLFAGRLGAAMV
jgi:hypothetical protein